MLRECGPTFGHRPLDLARRGERASERDPDSTSDVTCFPSFQLLDLKTPLHDIQLA